MFNKKTVYLSGPITGQSYNGASDRRDSVKLKLEKLNIECLDPMRAKDFLKNEKEIDIEKQNNVMITAKATISRDVFDVKNSDIVFVNFLGSKKVSIGSVIELAWAYQQQKPIILVIKKDNIHGHPWIKEMSGFIVESIEEGVSIVKAILNIKN